MTVIKTYSQIFAAYGGWHINDQVDIDGEPAIIVDKRLEDHLDDNGNVIGVIPVLVLHCDPMEQIDPRSGEKPYVEAVIEFVDGNWRYENQPSKTVEIKMDEAFEPFREEYDEDD